MTEAPRTYVIHTYGCQMNEHDTERIAGLLEADGLVAVDREEDADVIVYNTCTIRENADNRLFGNLGHVKQIKDRKPNVQIVVGGCQAQKDQGIIQKRAPWVDVVFGTHNVHRAAELIREAQRSGPIMEILEESEAFPSALPVRRDEAWSAWLTIQIGCDNSCAFCIVPSVRGTEISRTFAEVVGEATALADAGTVELTLLGQNVNSYGRDLTTQWRSGDWQSSEAVQACGADWSADTRGGPRSSIVCRSAPRCWQCGRDPAGALHITASEGPATRDNRSHGHDPLGHAPSSPPAAVGQRPHPRCHAPRLHR